MCRGIRSVVNSVRPNWARAETLAKYTAREARGKRGAQTVLEYVELRARSGASACFESRFWERPSNEAGRAQRRPPDTPARIAMPPGQKAHHKIHNPTLPRKTNQKTRPHRRVSLSKLVPRAGLEPARCHQRRILNPLRLPIPPPRRVNL